MCKEENGRVPRPVCNCKNCSDRQVGCHSTCAEYKHYLEANVKYTNTINKRKYEYGDSMRPRYNKHTYKR